MQVKYNGVVHTIVKNGDNTVSNSVAYCTHKHKEPRTKKDILNIINCEKCIEDVCAVIGSAAFNIGGPYKTRKVEFSQGSGKEEVFPRETEQEDVEFLMEIHKGPKITETQNVLYIFRRLLNDTVSTISDTARHNFRILYAFYVTNISLLSDESISEELTELIIKNSYKLVAHETLGVLSLNSHPPDPVQFRNTSTFNKSLSEIHADFFFIFLFSMRDRFAPTEQKEKLEVFFNDKQVDKLGSYRDMTRWPIIEHIPLDVILMTHDQDGGYSIVTKSDFFNWTEYQYILYSMRHLILNPVVNPSVKSDSHFIERVWFTPEEVQIPLLPRPEEEQTSKPEEGIFPLSPRFEELFLLSPQAEEPLFPLLPQPDENWLIQPAQEQWASLPKDEVEGFVPKGVLMWARSPTEIFSYDESGNAELTAFDEGDVVEKRLRELFSAYKYKFDVHPELMFLQMSEYDSGKYTLNPGTLLKLLITSFLHLTPESRDDIFVFGSKEIDKLPGTLERINNTFPRTERRGLYIRLSRYILLREIKNLLFEFAVTLGIKKRDDTFLPPERWIQTFHANSKIFTKQFEDAIGYTVNVQKKVPSHKNEKVFRYVKPMNEVEEIVFREEFYALFTLYNKELASLLIILIHYTEDPLRFFPFLMPELSRHYR